MSAIIWINPTLNILAIFCIFMGLYIAGRFLPSSITWLHSFYPSDLLAGQFTKTILWLALGALFASPLLDLLRSLGILTNITLVPQTGGEFTTLLGTVSPRVYLIFPFLLMIVIYCVIIFCGIDFITSYTQFRILERIFIVLAISSLVFGVVNSVFSQVLSFQIPFLLSQQNYGIFGYLFELMIGIIILASILLSVNCLLSKKG